MVLRRDMMFAGVNLMALAGSSVLAAATPSGVENAEGFVGPSVSTDDYIQILQLYNRYCHALDMASGAQFASTFTDDGEFTHGRAAGHAKEIRTPLKGREALARMATRGGTRHFTCNLIVTKTAEGADGSCYLLMFNARTNPATRVETSIYNDKLIHTGQGWKFKKRVVWRDDDDISPFKPKPLPERR